jgi:hypothetical protein
MGVLACCDTKRKRVLTFDDYVVDILSSTRFSEINFRQLYQMLFGTEFNATAYDKEGNKKIISQNEFLAISENFYSKTGEYLKIHQELFRHMSEILSFENKISCEKVLLLFLSLLRDTFSEKIVYFSHLINPYIKETIGEHSYYINNRIKFFFRAYLDENLIFYNKVIFATLFSTFNHENEFLHYFVQWFYRCKNENIRKFLISLSPHFEPSANFMTTSMKYYLDVFSDNSYLFDFYALRKEYQSRIKDIDNTAISNNFNYNDLEDKEYSNSTLMKNINNVHLRIENPEYKNTKGNVQEVTPQQN